MTYQFKFSVSLFLSSLIVLGMNLYYNFAHLIIPDGRWKTVVPITGLFVVIYLVLFAILSKKILTPQNYYLMIVYSIFLSIAFLIIQPLIFRSFQDNQAFYVAGYVLTAPYLFILGTGLVVYTLVAVIFEKIVKK